MTNAESEGSSMPNSGSLVGCRILLIEDDYLVGQVIIELLQDEGAEVLGPVGAVDEAVAFVADQATKFDRVVLDLNLHGIKSYPVADVLARHGIPFIFMTGYGKDALDEGYRDYPHCIKPVTRAALLTALARR
jgi:CheY-like chemotaxis protein